jgi:hypothetical protein
MIVTTVLHGTFSIASKNDLDDQNLLLPTVQSSLIPASRIRKMSVFDNC